MAQPKRRTTHSGLGGGGSLIPPQVRTESSPSIRRRNTRDIAASFAPTEPTTGVKPRKKEIAREAVQVDAIPESARRITIRGPVVSTPRVVNASRINEAPLDSRDAFVLQLIDGTLSMSDLADASGMSEADVEGIVARLIRLGIVAM